MDLDKLAKQLLEMGMAHEQIGHNPSCHCEPILARMRGLLQAQLSDERLRQQLLDRRVQTTKDLTDWFEHLDRTAQITYRTTYKPPYLVRIVKDSERHETTVEKMYVQATGDSLEEAFERCIEAYMAGGYVPDEHSGHKVVAREARKQRAKAAKTLAISALPTISKRKYVRRKVALPRRKS